MTAAESAYTRRLRPILIVDGRGWKRDEIARAANEVNCRPRTLPNEVRALIHLAKRDEQFDVLVLPPRLDEMEPVDLASRAREHRPALPVLFVCEPHAASHVERMIGELGLSGVRTRVVRTNSRDRLRDALEELLRASADEVPALAPCPPRRQAAEERHELRLEDDLSQGFLGLFQREQYLDPFLRRGMGRRTGRLWPVPMAE